jgi:hypothetical protein
VSTSALALAGAEVRTGTHATRAGA